MRCLLPASSETLEEHAPGMLTHGMVSFLDFSCLVFDFEYFSTGFKVSQKGASVWRLAAVLRRPQNKHALEYAPVSFVVFTCVCAIFQYPSAIFKISQQVASVRHLRRFADLSRNTLP